MLAENVLRKHVAIIHAYSMMSTLQRKIFNVLLYEAINAENKSGQDGLIAVECLMSFSKLISAVNFNSHNTQYLKEAIDSLASLKIEWNLLKDKVPTNISFLNLRALHGSPTFFQNGSFNFSFHKLMLDLVKSPDIYGTIDIDLQRKFESKYGHSLYENSTRFVNMQKNKIVQLDTFRKLLGVNEDKYQNMRELTRNVIKPALEEVNDRAGFVVNLQNVRVGRKVIGFELSVTRKEKRISVNSENARKKTQHTLNEIIRTFGKISDSVLESILKNYSSEYIFEKIDYVKQRAKKDKSGFYPVPYFISALRDDYRSGEQLAEENEEQHESNEREQRWCEKLEFLHLDLTTWQRNLQAAKSNDNPSVIDNINNIIGQCEKALEQHLLEKPDVQQSSEAG